MKFNPSEINELLKARIENLESFVDISTQGTVISVFDGITQIYGLSNVMQGELIKFSNKKFGIALNLEHNFVGAVVLGDYTDISEGDSVRSTGKIISVPIGRELCGRVLNALGNPIDGFGSLKTKKKDKIEKIAPGVISRKSVSQSLQTGILAIDSMIPIGLGQRELIIGDRQTGKTTIAVDTIINQKDKNIICLYVAIGQKASNINNIFNTLMKHEALKYTIILSSTSSESAIMQFLSPYSGCTMGEYFRDRGQDALIIYDDLTRHAWSHRQISLLLKRPPGREAYPGDIFYIHSKLLERASRVNEKYVEEFTNGRIKNKTGSLTAIPIIETQFGDVSSFIPTNVISITDGQIFLETDLFNSGIKPAINAGISVSRVGGSAQFDIVKKLSGNIRTELAQYKEISVFSQFSSDLDISTKKQLERGKRIVELLKQKKHELLKFWELVLILYSINKGYLDNVEISKIEYFKRNFLSYLKNHNAELVKSIEISKSISNSDEINIKKIYKEFIKTNLIKF